MNFYQAYTAGERVQCPSEAERSGIRGEGEENRSGG